MLLMYLEEEKEQRISKPIQYCLPFQNSRASAGLRNSMADSFGKCSVHPHPSNASTLHRNLEVVKRGVGSCVLDTVAYGSKIPSGITVFQ